MVFSSILFLVYFLPVLLLFYWLADKKYKNILLLIFSLIFYAWGEPRFVFVLLFTTLLDFFLVQKMDEANSERNRKIYLFISLAVNLSLLFYFKYCNFFIDNVNTVLRTVGIGEWKLLDVIMPIGISFYTFETITYVMDVYRKVHKPLKNFWEYQLYITFFPKLIAGPIVRYHDIADQINGRFANENTDQKLNGFFRFAIGLAKKVLIANTLARIADDIFANALQYDTLSHWIGILAYTFQIYFDFSGYSDMALGISRMLGFTLPENFNNPYNAKGITEFWRRWHISLGAWMKNYLYIPLGGNRTGNLRLYINLCIVFIASGFWHGASWTFLTWGAYHGLFLVIERVFLGKALNKVKPIAILYSFVAVMIGWVFFRSNTLHDAFSFIKGMVQAKGALSYHLDSEYLFFFILAAIFSFVCLIKPIDFYADQFFKGTVSLKAQLFLFVICIMLLVICIAAIAGGNFNPFIYFRF